MKKGEFEITREGSRYYAQTSDTCGSGLTIEDAIRAARCVRREEQAESDRMAREERATFDDNR